MTQLSKVSFNVPTTNADGSSLTAGEITGYQVAIDTVTPPVKLYTVPAADVTPVNGVVTATFAQLGFVPVSGTTYYAAAVADSAAGNSAESNVVSFTYVAVPAAPTGFTVS